MTNQLKSIYKVRTQIIECDLIMTLATKETGNRFPLFPLHNSNLSSLLSMKPGENSGEITFLDNDQPRLYLKVISTHSDLSLLDNRYIISSSLRGNVYWDWNFHMLQQGVLFKCSTIFIDQEKNPCLAIANYHSSLYYIPEKPLIAVFDIFLVQTHSLVKCDAVSTL